MRRRYVFFDVDGTLVSHVGESHIPPETREAVRLLKERGHVPAIATGRGAFLTRSVAEELGIGLLVCAGGAHILAEGRTLEISWLSETALASFRETTEEWPDITAALDDRFLYTGRKGAEFRGYFEAQAGYPCVRPCREMRRALLVCLMAPPPLPEGYGLFSSPPPDVVLEPMQHFVEARAGGTSKWEGIRRVMEHLRAPLEDVVAFGDGPNDVEMLRRAAVGVAVGRASEEAKDAASLIAGDIDEGGILGACAGLGLIPS